MTLENRNEMIKKFIMDECLPTLDKKGADYSGMEDGNKNFKETAIDLNLTKYQVWAVYFKKHTDAVINSIKTNPQHPRRQSECLKESLKDIINYASILYTLLEEDYDEISLKEASE